MTYKYNPETIKSQYNESYGEYELNPDFTKIYKTYPRSWNFDTQYNIGQPSLGSYDKCYVEANVFYAYAQELADLDFIDNGYGAQDVVVVYSSEDCAIVGFDHGLSYDYGNPASIDFTYVGIQIDLRDYYFEAYSGVYGQQCMKLTKKVGKLPIPVLPGCFKCTLVGDEHGDSGIYRSYDSRIVVDDEYTLRENPQSEMGQWYLNEDVKPTTMFLFAAISDYYSLRGLSSMSIHFTAPSPEELHKKKRVLTW